MLNNINLQDHKWVRLVFENVNKAYGAYKLRCEYAKNMGLALYITLATVLITLVIPFILQFIKYRNNTEQPIVTTNEITELMPSPPIDPTLPPPPPPPADPIPPPLRKAVKFTPPVIKKDSEIAKKVPPPPVLDDLKADIGIKNIEGKTEVPPTIESDNDLAGDGQVFLHVEEAPNFPGGLQAFYSYIANNINYPPLAREAGIEGRVFIQFIVEKDGSVTDIKVLKGLGYGCDQEAVRVISNSPKWEPGKQNGQAVRVQYNIPIVFQLT